MTHRMLALVATFLALTGSATAAEKNGLTFQLAEALPPDNGICVPPKEGAFKILGAPLLTSKDVLKASLFQETRDITNEKLVKTDRSLKNKETTTWGKEAGHPVRFTHYVIQLTLSDAGAASFANGYRGNFGKWILTKVDGRIVRSDCIREMLSSDSLVRPMKVISLTLGSHATETEARALLDQIQQQLQAR